MKFLLEKFVARSMYGKRVNNLATVNKTKRTGGKRYKFEYKGKSFTSLKDALYFYKINSTFFIITRDRKIKQILI